MAKQKKGKVFIILGLLLAVGLIPLLKAKSPEPPEPPELGGDVTSTQFTRVNGLI